MTKEIIGRVRDMQTDELTDEEVIEAINWFKQLEKSLRLMGATYYLAYRDMEHYLRDIEREGYDRNLVELPF